MTFELIFAVVTAVITGVLGAIMKNRVIPSKYIPIQNIVIGIISGLIAVYFGLFQDIPTALVMSLAIALGVGGAYDATQIPNKK
jgi:hypothetical protein